MNRSQSPSSPALLAPRLGAGFALCLSACAPMIGNMSAAMGDKYVVPQIMRGGDVGIACRTGGSMGTLIASFSAYSSKAERSAITTRMAAGMCLDQDVWEAQLARSRAVFEADAATATDARIQEKRARYRSAVRYGEAFAALEASYGLGQEAVDAPLVCPTFKTDNDRVTFLLGLSSGVLAATNHTIADNSAGVSMDVPARVARYAGCLDNDRWWGVPGALQAAVWSVLPTAPTDRDPWAMFDESIAIGQSRGVRLAIAFKAQAAALSGRSEDLHDAILAMGEATDAGDPDWAMLDAYARTMVQHESDLLWTTATGHRTPFGQLGSLPDLDDSPPELPSGFDDLFAPAAPTPVP